VPGRVVGCVGPVESRVVGQGHVACTKLMEGPELREAILDGHAPLDADQRGDLAGLGNALDVIGGPGEFRIGKVFLDQPMDQVDLLGDRPRGVLVLPGNVDRPELCLHSPFAEPGDGVAWSEQTFGDQRFAECQGLVAVDLQDANGYAADCGAAGQHEADVVEVVTPCVAAGVEQAGQLPRLRVQAGDL